MKDSNLLLLFNALSEAEKRGLRKFVRSPFFNQREDVIRLFDYLVKTHWRSDKNLDRRMVFKAIFPEQPAFEEATLRHTMSFLMKVIQEYLAYEEFKRHPLPNQIHLCKALRRKGMGKLFEKTWIKAQQSQKQQDLRNGKYHYHNYQLYVEQYEYTHQEKRRGDINLQELSDELSVFFIADILRQACSILSHQIINPQDYQLKLLQEVIQHVEQNDYTQLPAISIYYHSYQALTHPEREHHFQQLKQLIDSCRTQFPPAEMRNILLLAINYCIQRINKGAPHYLKELFDLYHTGLSTALLLENDILSRFTYKNVLRTALALEEFEWAEQFLHQYKQYLRPSEQEQVYLYNLAIFYFRQSDYPRAMQLLQQVEFKDVLYSLDARRMLLHIYYQRKEYAALESLLDSFKTYIYRHKKDLGYHKQSYLNLIHFMHRLLRSDLGNPATRQQLRTAIEATENLAEKHWLLELV